MSLLKFLRSASFNFHSPNIFIKQALFSVRALALSSHNLTVVNQSN